MNGNHGGGFYQAGGTATLTYATIANNKAGTGFGGGIYVAGGTLSVQNTIFSKNSGLDCGGGTVGSLGYNLTSDTLCATLGAMGDKQNKNAKLGPLANNGGPTQTHMLLAGSPAINGGTTLALISADQRGVARPKGGKPDMGAVEAQ